MKKIKKLSFIGLLLILIFLLSVGVAANAEWEIKYDGYIITDGTENYQLYWEDDAQCRIDPRSAVYYANMVEYNGEYRIVYTSSAENGILWIDNGGKNLIFATQSGVKYLEQFLSDDSYIYYLEDGKGNYAKIPGNVMVILEMYIDEADTRKTLPAKELRDMLRFDVTLHDHTETLAGEYGALFELTDGQYYFLRYSDCGRKSFDGKGYFVYNDTEVTLVKLNDNVSMDLIEVMGQMTEKTTEEIHEDDFFITWDEEYEEGIDGFFLALFWIFYLFIGMVVPAAGIVVGSILPISEKHGRPKYWYALTVSCTVWLISALALAILLII